MPNSEGGSHKVLVRLLPVGFDEAFRKISAGLSNINSDMAKSDKNLLSSVRNMEKLVKQMERVSASNSKFAVDSVGIVKEIGKQKIGKKIGEDIKKEVEGSLDILKDFDKRNIGKKMGEEFSKEVTRELSKIRVDRHESPKSAKLNSTNSQERRVEGGGFEGQDEIRISIPTVKEVPDKRREESSPIMKYDKFLESYARKANDIKTETNTSNRDYFKDPTSSMIKQLGSIVPKQTGEETEKAQVKSGYDREATPIMRSDKYLEKYVNKLDEISKKLDNIGSITIKYYKDPTSAMFRDEGKVLPKKTRTDEQTKYADKTQTRTGEVETGRKVGEAVVREFRRSVRDRNNRPKDIADTAKNINKLIGKDMNTMLIGFGRAMNARGEAIARDAKIRKDDKSAPTEDGTKSLVKQTESLSKSNKAGFLQTVGKLALIGGTVGIVAQGVKGIIAGFADISPHLQAIFKILNVMATLVFLPFGQFIFSVFKPILLMFLRYMIIPFAKFMGIQVKSFDDFNKSMDKALTGNSNTPVMELGEALATAVGAALAVFFVGKTFKDFLGGAISGLGKGMFPPSPGTTPMPSTTISGCVKLCDDNFPKIQSAVKDGTKDALKDTDSIKNALRNVLPFALGGTALAVWMGQGAPLPNLPSAEATPSSGNSQNINIQENLKVQDQNLKDYVDEQNKLLDDTNKRQSTDLSEFTQENKRIQDKLNTDTRNINSEGVHDWMGNWDELTKGVKDGNIQGIVNTNKNWDDLTKGIKDGNVQGVVDLNKNWTIVNSATNDANAKAIADMVSNNAKYIQDTRNINSEGVNDWMGNWDELTKGVNSTNTKAVADLATNFNILNSGIKDSNAIAVTDMINAQVKYAGDINNANAKAVVDYTKNFDVLSGAIHDTNSAAISNISSINKDFEDAWSKQWDNTNNAVKTMNLDAVSNISSSNKILTDGMAKSHIETVTALMNMSSGMQKTVQDISTVLTGKPETLGNALNSFLSGASSALDISNKTLNDILGSSNTKTGEAFNLGNLKLSEVLGSAKVAYAQTMDDSNIGLKNTLTQANSKYSQTTDKTTSDFGTVMGGFITNMGLKIGDVIGNLQVLSDQAARNIQSGQIIAYQTVVNNQPTPTQTQSNTSSSGGSSSSLPAGVPAGSTVVGTYNGGYTYITPGGQIGNTSTSSGGSSSSSSSSYSSSSSSSGSSSGGSSSSSTSSSSSSKPSSSSGFTSYANSGLAAISNSLSSSGKKAIGGFINEEIMGVGLRTGQRYSFGELGRREIVIPQGGASGISTGAKGSNSPIDSMGGKVEINVPIQIYTNKDMDEAKIVTLVQRALKDAIDRFGRLS